MTLRDLAHMRRLGAIPAMPVVLTNESDVHAFCAANDLPVMWLPAMPDDADLMPLLGLDLWLIGEVTPEVKETVKASRPYSLWQTGRFGFSHRVNQLVGREAMVCK